MNTTPPSSRPAPLHVPILTEVVELDEPVPTVPAGFDTPMPAQAMPMAQPAPRAFPSFQQAPVPAPTIPVPLAVPAPAALSPAFRPAPLPSPTPPFDEALVTQRVLTEVQRQIDGMLEYRLRETLAPILARASEALVRELRQELSKTMRDVVSRAVAQEVVRQRTR